jgi:hypothetical protein
MAGSAFAMVLGFGLVGGCLELPLAALVGAFRGFEAGLEVAGDASAELGSDVGKLSLVLEVTVVGAPAMSGGAVVAAGGNRDAGFCVVWQEVVPRATVAQSAMSA